MEKILELNQTLPKANHVDCSALMKKLMEVRRLEMRSWECMLGVKDRKVEKADLVEMVHLCRMLFAGEVHKEQLFGVCEKYLREANLCTFIFRLEVLHRVIDIVPHNLAV